MVECLVMLCELDDREVQIAVCRLDHQPSLASTRLRSVGSYRWLPYFSPSMFRFPCSRNLSPNGAGPLGRDRNTGSGTMHALETEVPQRGRAATNGTDAMNRRQQRQQRITLSVSSVVSCSINSRPFLVTASRLQKRADPPPCLRVPVRDPGLSRVQSEPRRAHSPPHSVWPASQLRAGVELRSRSRRGVS